MTYYITETEKHKLQYASKKFYPFEICGVIGMFEKGNRKFLTTLFIENKAVNPRRNFKLRAEDIKNGKKILEANSLKFSGYFHSHPSTYAIPTSSDKNMNSVSSLWLICSVCYKELNLYFWNKNQFEKCELIIEIE